MIVQPINRNVQVSDAMQRTRATMLASPEMLRRAILPYTKLELAAVRETINNAADSSTNLAIQIPTKLEPVVRIRDYGPGIPAAQIYNFYSVAGYSTKTQVNTTHDENGNEIHVMGCKGVGRFAPLGVTEQFTFHNYVDGRCIVGQVFFDSEGYPTVDILDDSPTGEPTGVEISFAVDPARIPAFRDAFHECLVNFPDHYSVTFLGEPLDIIKPQPALHGTNWYFDEKPGIIMGRIKYDVDASEFYVSSDSQLWTAFNHGLVLRVDLGSVDVNDARESIVYNDRTKTAIKNTAKTVFAEYQNRIDAAYATCANAWEAAALYGKMTNSDSRQVFGTPTFKGKPVRSYVEFNVPEGDLVSVIQDSGRRNRRKSTATAGPSLPYWLTPRGRLAKNSSYHLHPQQTLVILVDDDKQYLRRLAAYVDDPNSDFKSKTCAHMIETRYRGYQAVFVYDAAKLQLVLDALGGAPVHLKTSDLPPAPALPKQPRGPRAPVAILPYVYNATYDQWNQATTQLDANDPNILWCEWEDRKAWVRYSELKHPTLYKIGTFKGGLLASPAKSFVNRIKALTDDGYVFVALTKPLQAKVGKTKWRYLSDVTESLVTKYIDQPEVRRAYALRYAMAKQSTPNVAAALIHYTTHTDKILDTLNLPHIVKNPWYPVSYDIVPEEWRDMDFLDQLDAALADRPLFKYLACNSYTPDTVIINYLKEGK